MSSKRPRVHLRYKTEYCVKNRRAYDRALVARGDLTLWITPEALEAWRPSRSGRRGAQPKFSDLAIETALTLRTVFNLPLRQTEGFLRPILRIMDLEIESPDHTILSRRGEGLLLDLRAVAGNGPVHLLIDSSGLSAQGEGGDTAGFAGPEGLLPGRRVSSRTSTFLASRKGGLPLSTENGSRAGRTLHAYGVTRGHHSRFR